MNNEDWNIDAEQMVYEAFATQPEFKLSENFTDALVDKMEKSFAWQQYLREFVIYLAVVLGIVVITAVLAFVWYEAKIDNWLTFLASNLSWVIGINFLCVFVLFTDRVLLRFFMHRMHLQKD